MTTDEAQIRILIERWALAVHNGDLDAVLADHADDIVMFDVPPPDEGELGESRPIARAGQLFFVWQRDGACFELISLDVVAGTDVAFAYGLLRCGTSEDLKGPDGPAAPHHQPS